MCKNIKKLFKIPNLLQLISKSPETEDACLLQAGKSEDKRQKTEDGSPKTKNKRRETEVGRQKPEDRRWKVEGGRWETEVGRQKPEDGRGKVEGGRRKTEDGRWEMTLFYFRV
jgi:hypothetical protein